MNFWTSDGDVRDFRKRYLSSNPSTDIKSLHPSVIGMYFQKRIASTKQKTKLNSLPYNTCVVLMYLRKVLIVFTVVHTVCGARACVFGGACARAIRYYVI